MSRIRPSHFRELRTCLLLVVLIGLTGAGCSRSFWRRQADSDVYDQIDERIGDPRWDLPRIDIRPDPSSRFYSPYDPDEPPLPPDDPAAHRYMHRLDGMNGYKGWHDFGEEFSVENPQWLAQFGASPEVIQASAEAGDDPPLPGIDELTMTQSVELAGIHSREYQTAIEDLYLASLDLTFDRFQFAVRYLGIGGGEPTLDLTHESIPGGRNSLSLDKRFGVSQLLPTGGQWALELANNTLWLFAGEDRASTQSVLSYSLVQPLLLGAGRKVVLEDLTQSERNVLYAARDLARFRKEFFTGIVAGGASGGYLGLLAQRQAIKNQYDNLRRLEQQVVQLRESSQQASVPLEELPEGLRLPSAMFYNERNGRLYWFGPLSAEQEQAVLELSDDPGYLAAARQLVSQLRSETVSLEVAQLLSQLASSRNALRSSEVRYQDSLDAFKIQLGLPTDFRLSIDESPLEQFELIDPRLVRLEDDVRTAAERYAEADPAAAVLRDAIAYLDRLRRQVLLDGIELIESDYDRVQEILPSRLEEAEDDAERREIVRNVERDRQLLDTYRDDFDDLTERLEQLSTEVGVENLTAEKKIVLRTELATVRDDLLKLVQNLQVIQIGLRTEMISLNEFTMPLEDSVAIGIENRLDLMNVRAQVMDARRRLEVAANRLEAVLDVVVEGDVRTPVGIRPLDFRGENSSFRAGLQFTTPLDQVAERNDYRAALIEYQRARRAYMAFEDQQVKLAIRESWRALSVGRRNFETARQAVRIAALQYDNAVESASDPAGTGRNQGLNLLNALRSVLNAQNDLIGIWVDYERNRLNIFRDMGIMEIDARGVWTDPFYQSAPTESPPDDAFLVPPPAPPAESASADGPAGNRTVSKRPLRIGGGERVDFARFVDLDAEDAPLDEADLRPGGAGPADRSGRVRLSEPGGTAPGGAAGRR